MAHNSYKFGINKDEDGKITKYISKHKGPNVWDFLATVNGKEQLQFIRRKLQVVLEPCKKSNENKNIYYFCQTNWTSPAPCTCTYKLLARSEDSVGYHIFTQGKHDHVVIPIPPASEPDNPVNTSRPKKITGRIKAPMTPPKRPAARKNITARKTVTLDDLTTRNTITSNATSHQNKDMDILGLINAMVETEPATNSQMREISVQISEGITATVDSIAENYMGPNEEVKEETSAEDLEIEIIETHRDNNPHSSNNYSLEKIGGFKLFDHLSAIREIANRFRLSIGIHKEVKTIIFSKDCEIKTGTVLPHKLMLIELDKEIMIVTHVGDQTTDERFEKSKWRTFSLLLIGLTTSLFHNAL